MSRPPRARKSRFSMAPIMLGLGLALAYALVSRLVPMVWSSMLPGGLNQASTFRGWAGLVFAVALEAHRNFVGTVGFLCAIGAAGFLIATFARPLRPIVWLMAVAVIMIDAGIVYVTLRAAVEATAMQAGIF